MIYNIDSLYVKLNMPKNMISESRKLQLWIEQNYLILYKTFPTIMKEKYRINTLLIWSIINLVHIIWAYIV